MDEVIPKLGISKRPSSSLIPGAKTSTGLTGTKSSDPAVKGFPITFKHLGKRGYEQTLFATSSVQRRKWMEHIEAQQTALRDKSNVFTKTNLCEGFFNSSNKVNCLVPIGEMAPIIPYRIHLTMSRRRS
jgi:RHO1 GDP-GTP exchange protein 1/2